MQQWLAYCDLLFISQNALLYSNRIVWDTLDPVTHLCWTHLSKNFLPEFLQGSEEWKRLVVFWFHHYLFPKAAKHYSSLMATNAAIMSCFLSADDLLVVSQAAVLYVCKQLVTWEKQLVLFVLSPVTLLHQLVILHKMSDSHLACCLWYYSCGFSMYMIFGV